jgi:hypothetical protein
LAWTVLWLFQTTKLSLISHHGRPKEAKEGRRVHQQPTRSGHEVRQVPVGLQKDPRDSSHGQGKIGYYCQQHTSPKVSRWPLQKSLFEAVTLHSG